MALDSAVKAERRLTGTQLAALAGFGGSEEKLDVKVEEIGVARRRSPSIFASSQHAAQVAVAAAFSPKLSALFDSTAQKPDRNPDDVVITEELASENQVDGHLPPTSRTHHRTSMSSSHPKSGPAPTTTNSDPMPWQDQSARVLLRRRLRNQSGWSVASDTTTNTGVELPSNSIQRKRPDLVSPSSHRMKSQRSISPQITFTPSPVIQTAVPSFPTPTSRQIESPSTN